MARPPLTISGFFPQAEVTIHCAGGVTYTWDDIKNDIVSINLQRSVDGSAGAFGLTLLANTDSKGNTWADRINAMDYVEIRMGNYGSTVATLAPNVLPPRSSTLPMRFRGFVDNAGYSTIFSASGGPQRAVTINGRDYTKLFMISNIQYLWTSSALAAGMAAAQFGLSFNYNLPWEMDTVSDFVHGVIGTIFNGQTAQPAQWSASSIMANSQAASGETTISGPAAQGGGNGNAFLPQLRAGGVDVPLIQIACSVPDKYSLVSLAVQPYTGPIINLLTYFQSPPLGEMFVYDNEDGPVLVYRVTPLKGKDGMFVSPAQDPSLCPLQLPHVLTSTNFSPGKNITKTDNELYNYFFVYSDIASTDNGSSAMYVSKGIGATNFSIYSAGNTASNPYWNSDSTKRFGLRPMNVDSPWVPFINVNGSYQSLSIELATFLGQTYGFNETLWSGSIQQHGDPLFIPGRYIGITDENTGDLWSFYLESVTDTFNFKPSPEPGWTAQLGVTRGFKTSTFA